MSSFIVVEMRQKAGGICVYPVCEKARAIAAISGHKTLTLETLQHVRTLGFEVRQAEDVRELRELEDVRRTGTDDRKVVSIAGPVTQVPSLNPKRGLARIFR